MIRVDTAGGALQVGTKKKLFDGLHDGSSFKVADSVLNPR